MKNKRDWRREEGRGEELKDWPHHCILFCIRALYLIVVFASTYGAKRKWCQLWAAKELSVIIRTRNIQSKNPPEQLYSQLNANSIELCSSEHNCTCGANWQKLINWQTAVEGIQLKVTIVWWKSMGSLMMKLFRRHHPHPPASHPILCLTLSVPHLTLE